jgi:hypothetical protein
MNDVQTVFLFTSCLTLVFSIIALCLCKLTNDEIADFLESRSDFYSSVLSKIRNCETEINAHASILSKLDFPYGTRKDGTPKAKPGRKAREQS